jgi:hypothetical protein
MCPTRNACFRLSSSSELWEFENEDEEGTEMRFPAPVTNANLRGLMADLGATTNAALDGRLDLQLAVTEARTDRADSWNGFGQVALRDGLIWAIPIFSVLSEPLDAMMPGVGRSRISSATASFLITNSVRSEDLEMRSPTMRLRGGFRRQRECPGNRRAAARYAGAGAGGESGPVAGYQVF